MTWPKRSLGAMYMTGSSAQAMPQKLVRRSVRRGPTYDRPVRQRRRSELRSSGFRELSAVRLLLYRSLITSTRDSGTASRLSHSSSHARHKTHLVQQLVQQFATEPAGIRRTGFDQKPRTSS